MGRKQKLNEINAEYKREVLELTDVLASKQLMNSFIWQNQ